ncbi:MAG TPA: GNAT family N-acetyltransferase [Thermoanaerobaculia bacterium]
MTIRPAAPTDVSQLADLTTQLGYPTRPEEAEARLRDLASRPEENAVLVAEEDGEAVGWIHVSALYSLEMDPCAQIQGLVVDASRRGGGIGAALVEAAAAWAAGHGFRTLRVRSNVIRERTHAFYERLGFARTKSQVVLVRPIG